MLARTIGALAALSAACVCGGEPFFKVDVNTGRNSGGTLQPGWSYFGWSVVNVAGPLTNHYDVASSAVTDGGLDVVIAAGSSPEDVSTITARDRDKAQVVGSGFPLADLYRDWVNPNNPVAIWVRIMGLRPGVAYVFTAYGYDDNNTSTVTVTPMSDGASAGQSGTFSYAAATEFSAETDPGLCATALTVVADGEGTLTFKLTGSPKPPVLGGFTLAESDDKVFSLFLDFGDGSSAKVADGAQLFSYTESIEPRSSVYANQLYNGSSGSVTVTLTQGTGLESKKFIVRDRETSFPDTAGGFPGYQQYRDCAILSQGSSMWVAVEGLLPNAKYAVTVCPYDYNYGRTSTVADWTSGAAGASTTFTTVSKYALTAETPTDLYTAGFRLRSDAEGRIRLLNSVASGEVALSWLKIDYLPPDPGLLMIVR